jgi:AcrR family transcriptional regulator
MPARSASVRRAQPLAARRSKRPLLRDAEKTRALVLEAASVEFARHGLGGARVDRIAAQAGVNVRMLYYYFTSKDALFLAVLERAYRAIREAEQGLELEQIDPREAVRSLVRFTWGFPLAHPEFKTLLKTENQPRGRHLTRSKQVAGLHSRQLELIGRLLERGAKTGVFRRGVDPMQLYITIAGLGYFYLSNRHTLSAIFGRDLMAPRYREARMAHRIDVVLGYLKP